jgi:hypothetical protein
MLEHPWCSSGLPGVLGTVVDDTWDDYRKDSFMMWLYLTAKPSYVGVDVDGLAYPLHRPMVPSCETRGHGLLPDVVLSCHCNGRWRLSGDVKPLGLGELTTSVPPLPNLTWGKSFLPQDAYPMAESSWCWGVYSWSICSVRRRWDKISTWIHTIRCV